MLYKNVNVSKIIFNRSRTNVNAKISLQAAKVKQNRNEHIKFFKL